MKAHTIVNAHTHHNEYKHTQLTRGYVYAHMIVSTCTHRQTTGSTTHKHAQQTHTQTNTNRGTQAHTRRIVTEEAKAGTLHTLTKTQPRRQHL